MCVIALAAKERLTTEQIAKMYGANPHGAGVAWRDGAEVRWKKGLDLEEAIRVIKDLPMPYVAHFRIPSCGGPSKLLTHPFPIARDVPLALEGSTTGFVLFHNGHWGTWKTTMLDASVRGNGEIPIGKWSDSRAMAWMAAHYGIGMLEFIDEKAIAFGPEQLELFSANSWSKVGDGIWVSNKGWESERIGNQYMKPPYYGVAPKKDDKDSAPTADSEDHTRSLQRVTSKSDGKRSTVSGNGGTQTSVTQKESGGTSLERPLAQYKASVKLWQDREIGKQVFKRERKKYETWCRERKIEPLPKPLRDQSTIH